ncbi:uncharacterized protein QC763_0083830 [Podospora pseudopauciseta]|uniref:Uncharacterized protein n=1 Tax=Podospora pseudopauciseta TaxID=2093780 RepID=A0ABR0H8J3_9PEZI|nr:hypothetical protein QC763_0083830 [Podospora pseudopauciseta]
MVKGGQDFEIHLCLAIHPGPHGGSVGGRRCAVFAPAAHISEYSNHYSGFHPLSCNTSTSSSPTSPPVPTPSQTPP